MQPYQLPDLPYAYEALEPYISKEIMQLHHDKHHATYVKNLNDALNKYVEAEQNRDVATMVQLQQTIKFNGGGHINHSIFWTNLAPKAQGGGNPPQGAFAEAINKEFGSLQKLIDQMTAKAIPLQGSGWAWLGFNTTSKKLVIETCENQDPLITKGLVPLLGIDVWEHSYYLQYKNVRADYVKAIWNVVNWKNVEERYMDAQK